MISRYALSVRTGWLVLLCTFSLLQGAIGQARYTITDLGSLTSTPQDYSFGRSVNNLGHVVGNGFYPYGYDPFFWSPTTGIFDFLNSGYPHDNLGGDAVGINDSDVVVGYIQKIVSPTQAVGQAYSWSATTGFTMLPGLGGPSVSAAAINNAGVIAGTAQVSSDAAHAVTWQNGKISDLRTLPGDTSSSASGINNLGHVVGSGSSNTAFIWTAENGMQALPGGSGVANAINDQDVIVGQSTGIACRWTGKQQTILGLLSGDVNSIAYGINNTGQIVGSATSLNGQEKAVLWENDIPNDLNTLLSSGSGWMLIRATSINEKGDITGYGIHNGQGGHAFILHAADSDGDGIPDEWEQNGGFWSQGKWISLRDADPSHAPDPLHKDIYVWIDYMELPGDHSERPNDAAIDLVRKAFANAPVSNPDGAAGINLHVIIAAMPVEFTDQTGKKVTHTQILGTTDQHGNYDWTAFEAIKQSSTFPKEWASFCHYCLFAHDFDANHHSGIARSPGFNGGSDFLVTLGSFPSGLQNGKTVGHGGVTSMQAGTFMHELGHNLGLSHGGPTIEQGVLQPTEQISANFKPNYLSVMNYSFQFYGLIYQGRNQLFDYSRFKLPDLDEEHLNEIVGLGSSDIGEYGTTWYYGRFFDFNTLSFHYKQSFTIHADQSINWNQDYTFSGQDIIQPDITENVDGVQDAFGVPVYNIMCQVNGHTEIEPLRSYNDWDNLIYRGGTVGAGTPILQPVSTPVTELDLQTAMSLKPLPPSGIATRAASGTIRLNWSSLGLQNEWAYNIYRSSDGVLFTQIGSTSTTLFADTNIVKGKLYYYYVTGTNSLGIESNQSSTVTAAGR